MTRSIHLLSLIILVSSGISCGLSDEEKQAIINRVYEDNVAELTQERKEACREEALRQAEYIADSIVASYQINPLPDTLYQPHVPVKPEFVPIDSTVFDTTRIVRPILSEKS